MALIPCGHRLIIEPDKVEKETDWGLQLVSFDERLEEAGQQIGTIIAIGPDAWKAFRMMDDNGQERNGKPWAKVGDRVWYSRYAGKFILDPHTEKEYKLINDEDVNVIIKEEE